MSVLRRMRAIRLAHSGLGRSRLAEVGQLADLVRLHRAALLAPLTPAAQEPGDQLLAADGGRDRQAVIQDRLLAPFERDTAEPCHQWLPARPLGAGLETGPGPVRGDGDGLVLAGHLRHRRAVLGGQRLEHGGFRCPPQPVQPGDVPGEQVVLGQPPVFGSVGADDLRVVQVHQLGPVPRFTVLEVGGCLGRDHRPGDAQPDHAVDARAARAVLDGDVIAEEPRGLGAAVRDQRLACRQFQLEVLAQEVSQAPFDLLGFGLRAGEPEQVIVGIAEVPEPAVARVTGIPGGQAPPLLAQFPHRGTVAAAPGVRHRVGHLGPGRIGFPAFPSGIFRDEDRLGELIQPVQVNVRQDGGRDAALRRTGKRRVPLPVFQIPGPEHVLDQPQEPVIMDVLR